MIGPDFSSNNGHPINFTQVAQSSGFVFVKATQGATYASPCFAQDYTAARTAGLTVAPYHWVSPSSAPDAQAANLVNTIRDHYRPGDLPVALDFEQNGATHAMLDQVRAAIRRHGYRTLTYTYPDFWVHHGDPTCSQCAGDSLWYADYTTRQPAAVEPWKTITFWQYTDNATVAGHGGTDLSRYLGNGRQWQVLRGQPPVQHPVPTWWSRTLRVTHPTFLAGSDVATVQQKVGLTGGYRDGRYGPYTASKVQAFQHVHGLTADGIVGADTARALGQ